VCELKILNNNYKANEKAEAKAEDEEAEKTVKIRVAVGAVGEL
jgi:hypothetical protein